MEKGLKNWKKAIEKFTTHESSLSHTEAKVKWMAKGGPTIGSLLCSQTLQVQKARRAGFLCQLRPVQYLARQGNVRNLLRTVLEKIQANNPPWFSVIAEEATDVCNSAQLNLSIRLVNNKYKVLEDTVGLFRVPNIKAETLFMVIKDLLTRCNLTISLCHGQAYDWQIPTSSPPLICSCPSVPLLRLSAKLGGREHLHLHFLCPVDTRWRR